MNLQLYIRQTLEIIYVDRQGKFSQRTVTLLEVDKQWIRTYCYTRRAPRCFRIENVLAVRPTRTGTAG